MKGKRIETIADLANASRDQRAVVGCFPWSRTKPHPAAFIFSMTGPQIHRFITYGLYLYEKEKRDGNEPDTNPAPVPGE